MKKFLSILVAAALVSQSMCDCTVEQTHITLGDKYNLEGIENDHVLTIGLVTNSDCTDMPRIKLQVDEGKEIEVDYFTSKVADYQLKDQTLPNNDTVPYNKKALFFKITDSHIDQAKSWSVYQGNQLKEGPMEFPKRLRSSNKDFRMFVVADMDLTPNSAPTVAKIREIEQKDYDFLAHVGDFAYEIEDNGGRVGDEFFQEMSKTSKLIPYLITPGNHEWFGEGNLLNYRFRMPNIDDSNLVRANHFFDFVYKGAYFMVVDFDYLNPWYKKPDDPYMEIFNWMAKRIEILNKRKDITWKVFMSHRPFTCSDWTAKDCSMNMYWLRSFEDLLAKYGFQFLLQGHLHIYTRSKPTNGLVVYPQSKIGSGAMVSIIDGHSGTSHFFKNQSEEHDVWSSITAGVDASGPTYIMIEVSPKRFVSTLVRSDNGEYRDTFSIDRDMLEDSPKYRGRYRWFKFGMVSVLVICIVITAVLILRCIKNEYLDGSPDAESESLSKYQKVNQFDKNSIDNNSSSVTIVTRKLLMDYPQNKIAGLDKL